MNRKPDRYLVIIAALVFVALAAGIATASTVTQSITYQGKLTDAAANPLTGTYSVKFSLYEAATGGTALAADTHSVTAANGLFTTGIAVADPAIMDGRALWLGIRVGSDPEMTPRQVIRPVPYALGLRPGAVMSGTGTGNVFTIGTEGEGTALDVSAFSAGGQGLSVYASGENSMAVSAVASGTGSEALDAGTISDSSITVSASADGDDSVAIFASTTGTGSDAIEATTREDSSRGIYVFTEGKQSPGLYALTLNDGSAAVEAHAYGGSPAVYGEGMVGVFGTGKEGGYFTVSAAGTSSNDLRPGVNSSTTYPYSPGFRATTKGAYSDGAYIFTYGSDADGIYAATYGRSSDAVSVYTGGQSAIAFRAYTTGDSDTGMMIGTQGRYSHGISVTTENTSSTGVIVNTFGAGSPGITASSALSEGIIGEAAGSAGVKGSSTSKAGVWGVSTSDVGVYGDTISGTYGVFTPDKMYAGNGIDAPNVDVAEYMPATGDPAPGTVLVIGGNGKLEASAAAYDTRVAGIVSTAPGISLGTKEAGNYGETLVAVAGRVPCRVDAGYGAIHAGDLLSTSATPGHAMKAEPVTISGRGFYPDGTILGKAMGSLESGTGTIEVLVTLQ
ncbi:MAG: hypothetical protein EHM53_09015 [Methanoregulaceae archaeon]|nr:MAG: hypothetical protein EHM53_09015 [Methanoregulaceae archaeon]